MNKCPDWLSERDCKPTNTGDVCRAAEFHMSVARLRSRCGGEGHRAEDDTGQLLTLTKDRDGIGHLVLSYKCSKQHHRSLEMLEDV